MNWQLLISLESLMLPELEPLGLWGRTVHSAMLENTPEQMLDLDLRGELKSFCLSEQERLTADAQALGRSWQAANPLPSSASFFERAAWHNQAKNFARELLLGDVWGRYRAL